MSLRFTINGSNALEQCLAHTCDRVLAGVQGIVPARRLAALVLGGGYGRGQGGVLNINSGDRPYNDMEFYVFVRGNRLLNQRRFGRALNQLAEQLSPEAGLHVEFKIDSLDEFRRTPISMFSYDLVAGHRVLAGGQSVFSNCEHHLEPERIPLSEATRLLFNRCTGLLLARELLRQPTFTPEASDFVARNIAKAQLALGDAVLTAFGRYHWSCLERHQRLMRLAGAESLPSLERIQSHHQRGVEFKLHPRLSSEPASRLSEEHHEVSLLTQQLWLWLESRRLKCRFSSVREYSLSMHPKCPGFSGWRNLLLNLRSFGWKGTLGSMAWRYPRERLFNTLPLLLWNGEISNEPDLRLHIQRQLQTNASEWTGLVAVYKAVWPNYG